MMQSVSSTGNLRLSSGGVGDDLGVHSKGEHRLFHTRKLMEAATSIFVAATITSAFSVLLDYLCESGVELRIGLSVVHAVMTHLLMYFLTLSLPEHRVLYGFFVNIASDNTSFAWDSVVTLIIIKWLYTSSATKAVIAWIFLLVIVTLIIRFTSWAHSKYLVSSDAARVLLRAFENEVFAFALAYSLTVILAESMYKNASTNYLAYTDDVAPVTDDKAMISTSSYRDYLFLLYTVCITAVLVGTQWIIDQKALASRQHRNDSTDSFDKRRLLSEEERYPLWYQCGCAFVFGGAKNYWKSIVPLLETTLSFLAGSAWHVWSVLSLQNYFQHFPNGKLIGLTINAVGTSVVVILVMAGMSRKEERKETERQQQQERQKSNDKSYNTASSDGIQMDGDSIHTFNSLRSLFLARLEETDVPEKVQKKKRLIFNFGRLTVGWAWQELLVSAAAALVPGEFSTAADSQYSKRTRLIVISRFAASLVVLICAAIVEFYFQRRSWSPRYSVLESCSDGLEAEDEIDSHTSEELEKEQLENNNEKRVGRNSRDSSNSSTKRVWFNPIDDQGQEVVAYEE